jgi:hypothetical protein
MAQAAYEHTPTYNWSLDEAFRYLTRSCRLSDRDALYEMEQLRVEVQKYVDGKPESDPLYRHKDFRLFIHDRRWVVLEGLEGSDARCKVAEQDVRAAPSVVQSPQESLKSKDWLEREVERQKKLGDIPDTITEFSDQIHSQMKEALRACVVDRVISPRTIEQHLRVMGLFGKKKRSQKS